MSKNIIQEKLSSRLYHFTSLESLVEIINGINAPGNSNSGFKLSSAIDDEENDMHPTKKYYLSFTRQKNHKVGFPLAIFDAVGIVVRIEFNGDLLNQNFEGRPVDFFKGAKQSYYKKKKVSYTQEENESEDRLFFKLPVIGNINKYIVRVDILTQDEEDLDYWEDEFNFILNNYNKVYVYNTERDFLMQTNNTINKFLVNNMIKVQINEDDIRQMVSESVKNVIEGYSRDIDDDNYYGGGLSDTYFDEDKYIEATPDCDGYVVEDSKTGEVISIFRDKNNAIRECDKNHRWTYWGFNFKD